MLRTSLLNALQRTPRTATSQLHRASFSSTARLRDEASTRLKNTGTLPPYGPVGVAKALEASPSARTPAPHAA